MIGQGIGGPPRRLCHAASQLGRAMATWLCVSSAVTRLIVSEVA